MSLLTMSLLTSLLGAVCSLVSSKQATQPYVLCQPRLKDGVTEIAVHRLNGYQTHWRWQRLPVHLRRFPTGSVTFVFKCYPGKSVSKGLRSSLRSSRRSRDQDALGCRERWRGEGAGDRGDGGRDVSDGDGSDGGGDDGEDGGVVKVAVAMVVEMVMLMVVMMVVMAVVLMVVVVMVLVMVVVVAMVVMVAVVMVAMVMAAMAVMMVMVGDGDDDGGDGGDGGGGGMKVKTLVNCSPKRT